MNGAYNEKHKQLKNFSNYQFKAMEAALRAIEQAGYTIAKPRVGQE
jgi:hypothetical protein